MPYWILKPVSDDDLALVRRALDAFNADGANIDAAGDAPAGIYVDEPEVVPLRAVLEGTTFSGPSAIRDFWAASRESWTELHLEMDRIEPAGAGVLSVGTLTATSRETGARVESRVAFAIHIRDGRITRNAVHLSEADARRDLGAD